MHSSAPGVVVYRPTGDVDAIDEHSRRLVEALRAGGSDAEYVPGGLAAVRRGQSRPPWILLQYSAFSYGRWGVAPGVIRDAVALRRRTGARLAVLVHESWIELTDWRTVLMGGYQRAQLSALLCCADVVFATTEGIAREVGRDAVHLPVASNVTPLGIPTQLARERLGIAGGLVVALFGREHPSRAIEHAEAAIAALAQTAGPVTVLNLGDGAPALRVGADVPVRTPGRLDDRELSLWLSAGDLLLLPLTDGISTRRTTLMAALAHGSPVLGLHGTATDSVLRDQPAALALTPAGDPEAFARAAVELARDTARRHALGAAGRELYEERFDWPVLARRVRSALGAATAARSPEGPRPPRSP